MWPEAHLVCRIRFFLFSFLDVDKDTPFENPSLAGSFPYSNDAWEKLWIGPKMALNFWVSWRTLPLAHPIKRQGWIHSNSPRNILLKWGREEKRNMKSSEIYIQFWNAFSPRLVWTSYLHCHHIPFKLMSILYVHVCRNFNWTSSETCIFHAASVTFRLLGLVEKFFLEEP